MRLLRTKIYRAFPELDRFENATCERFIEVAWRAWRIRIAIVLACLVTGGTTALMPLLITVLAMQWIERNHPKHSEAIFPAFLAMCVIAVIAAPIVAFLTRDALLRLRVRSILRTRGTCVHCHYSLAGLPVGEHLLVTCPECQSISEVDPALGELSTAADGSSRYTPGPRSQRKPWLSPVTRLRLRYVMCKALPRAAALLALAWGSYELFLWRQAQTAMSHRPGLTGIMAYTEALQSPQGDNQTRDGWRVFALARDRQRTIDAALGKSPPPKVNGEQVALEWDAVYSPVFPEEPGERERWLARAVEAERYLKAYSQQGVFAAYDEISEAQRGFIPLNLPAASPAAMMPDAELTEIVRVEKMLTARLTVAAQAGNQPEIVAAYRTLLALARLAKMQPLAVEYLNGMYIECSAQEHIRSLLVRLPDAFDAQTLARLSDVAAEQDWAPPPSHPWEGERLCQLDAAASVFSNTSQVRFGRYSPSLKRAGILTWSVNPNELPDGHLGTFRGVMEELAARAQMFAHHGTLPRWARVQAPSPHRSSNVLIRTYELECEKVLGLRDELTVIRNGTAAMFLIERFRSEHGRVPASLEEACGKATQSILQDPCSGKPLVYRTIDPHSDRLRRPYLLYSVGADLCDNGGATSEGFTSRDYSALNQPHPNSKPTAQFDYVINSVR